MSPHIKPGSRILIITTLVLVVLFLFLATVAFTSHPPQAQAGTQPAPQMQKTPGLILPELPADAGQADYGWQAYRLVCSACHAYDGTGLTAEWISTWDPADQNCWQSKCHSANHPPDGFELPHYVPVIVGPGELDAYGTALDLYRYIEAAMPWQEPGYLTDKEYWDITAYLIKANGFTLPAEPLSEANAASYVIASKLDVTLTPPPVEPAPTHAAEQAPAAAPGSLIRLVAYILAGSAVIAVLYAFFFLRRK